jgi:hypothetical protein
MFDTVRKRNAVQIRSACASSLALRTILMIAEYALRTGFPHGFLSCLELLLADRQWGRASAGSLASFLTSSNVIPKAQNWLFVTRRGTRDKERVQIDSR